MLVRSLSEHVCARKQRTYTVTVRGNSDLKCTGTQERVGLTRLFTANGIRVHDDKFNFKLAPSPFMLVRTPPMCSHSQ